MSAKKMKQNEPVEMKEGIPKESLINLCLAAGYKKLHISFDGGGDDGQVDNIEVFRDLASTQEVLPTEVHPAMRKALEDAAYTILEDHFPGDWINNDGGYGRIIVTLTGDEPGIVLEASQRVHTTEDSNISMELEELLKGKAAPWIAAVAE